MYKYKRNGVKQVKQKAKIFLILVVVDLVIAFIYYLVNSQVRFSFLNASFFIGLMYLLAGAALLIHESGFFNPAKYYFHKLPIFPKSKLTNENDEEMTLLEYLKYRPTPLTSSKPLFLSGIFLVVLTYIISVVLY